MISMIQEQEKIFLSRKIFLLFVRNDVAYHFTVSICDVENVMLTIILDPLVRVLIYSCFMREIIYLIIFPTLITVKCG